MKEKRKFPRLSSLFIILLKIDLKIDCNFSPWNSFLNESPRWLISKGRDAAAYRIVFNKKCDIEFEEKMTSKAKEIEQEVLSH